METVFMHGTSLAPVASGRGSSTRLAGRLGSAPTGGQGQVSFVPPPLLSEQMVTLLIEKIAERLVDRVRPME